MKCNCSIRWLMPDKSELYELSAEPMSSLAAEKLLGEKREAMEVRGAEAVLANPGKTVIGRFYLEGPESLLALVYHAGHSKASENGWQLLWTDHRHTDAESFIRSFPHPLRILAKA